MGSTCPEAQCITDSSRYWRSWQLHPDLYLVVDNPAEWEELVRFRF